MVSKRSAPRIRLTLKSSAQASRHAVSVEPANTIIISPYLTSRTAESIIREANRDTAVVLTTFDAMIFATGGSKLGTLKKIHQLGFQLRAIQGLHAKLVVAGNCVHIGSQNLTAAGTRNKEATAIITSKAHVDRLRQDLKPWIAGSFPITAEMIADMERELGPHLELARKLAKGAEDVNSELWRLAADRQAAENKARKQRNENRAALRTALRQATRVGDVIKLTPSLNANPPTLRANADLTSWVDENSQHIDGIKKRSRYLAVLRQTGQLFWPAWNKTRLTHFGTNLTTDFDFRGERIEGKISFNMDQDTSMDWNVSLEFDDPKSHAKITLHAFFAMSGLDNVSADGGFLNSVGKAELDQHLQDWQGQLLEPFKYKRNRSGISAEKLYNAVQPAGGHLQIRCLQLSGEPFFLIENPG
jgi:hypothetical protein